MIRKHLEDRTAEAVPCNVDFNGPTLCSHRSTGRNRPIRIATCLAAEMGVRRSKWLERDYPLFVAGGSQFFRELANVRSYIQDEIDLFVPNQSHQRSLRSEEHTSELQSLRHLV